MSAQPRIPELDSFRAAAVLMVLASHCLNGWPLPPESTAWIPRLPLQFVLHGWLGVDLFFMLSGFLITGLLLDSTDRPRYFRNFYARRVLRILPLYFLCIGVMYLAYRSNGPYFGLALLFLANFSAFLGVAVPHGPDVFWSLSVEEHFYLVWPLLVRYLSRRLFLWLALAIVIASPILRGLGAYRGMNIEAEVYVYSWFRFDGLAFGALLALWFRSKYFSTAGAWKLAGLLIAAALAITIGGLPYGVMGTKTVAAVALRYTQAQLIFATCIALALAYRGRAGTRFLRTRFASLTAGYSYCIYLIHLALGDLYYWFLQRSEFNDVAYFGPIAALAERSLVIVGSSYLLAALSKRYLEDPFLRLKRYF